MMRDLVEVIAFCLFVIAMALVLVWVSNGLIPPEFPQITGEKPDVLCSVDGEKIKGKLEKISNWGITMNVDGARATTNATCVIWW